MATLNSIEVPSIASGTYESLTLPTAGTWFIKPRCQKYTLTGRLSEGADSLISQEGVGLNVKVSQADAPLTIYLQADCAENTTAKADYSDCFFEVGAEGEGGGGGGTTYSFSAPLQETGGNVSLGIKNDLKVETGNLTLDLNNNTDFQNLNNAVVKLTGNQDIAGNKTFTSKLEIDANNEVLKLKNSSNTSNYIAGYEGNTRIYYIGKDSSSSIDFSIKNECTDGWITLKTKSKFDQAYTITDNNQIVHKKYVDDTINTNCVKLTGNQDIAGNKTFTSKLEIDANNEVLKLKNSSNTSNYIAGYEGNTRIYYIGKDSSSSIDFSIKNECTDGWITLKTKSKFDQAYTITDNNQIVHKKYVDDTINTNCVKLTGNQDIAGNKKLIDYVDLDLAPNSTYPFMLRFVGDKWASNQSADLFRFHKYGGACGYKVYLNGVGGFGYAELWGLTLISNMKDPTADSHGANKRYVDSKTGDLNQLSTTAKGNLVESINEVSDNMPVVLPAGTQPTTSNVGSMKVAFVLKQ